MKDTEKLLIRDVSGGAAICVKVVPGSSRNGIVGVLGGSLKVATTAPPEKGRANAAVSKILAEAFGTDKRNVRLLTGASIARKEFLVAGRGAEQLRKLLQDI